MKGWPFAGLLTLTTLSTAVWMGNALPTFAEPHAKAVEEEQIVAAAECSKDKDIRRLEAHTRKAGCTLQYFKAGTTSEIASAQHSVELCRDRLKKVQARLEASGYKCK